MMIPEHFGLLTHSELVHLEQILISGVASDSIMTISELDGFLHAIAIGPMDDYPKNWLGVQNTTAQYVRSFFTSYIQEVFIGDYQELRTREHPLSKCQQILDAVTDIDTHSDQRSGANRRIATTYLRSQALSFAAHENVPRRVHGHTRRIARKPNSL
jgi:hypothetical protein